MTRKHFKRILPQPVVHRVVLEDNTQPNRFEVVVPNLGSKRVHDRYPAVRRSQDAASAQRGSRLCDESVLDTHQGLHARGHNMHFHDRRLSELQISM